MGYLEVPFGSIRRYTLRAYRPLYSEGIDNPFLADSLLIVLLFLVKRNYILLYSKLLLESRIYLLLP